MDKREICSFFGKLILGYQYLNLMREIIYNCVTEIASGRRSGYEEILDAGTPPVDGCFLKNDILILSVAAGSIRSSSLKKKVAGDRQQITGRCHQNF